uniref:DUF3383 family protein n=1 Tax=Chromobacterium haemolyticum TaxID=394935 RepID=UPI0005928CF6
MSQGLPVSGVVNVQWTLTPIAAALRNFGSLMILGSSNVINTTERYRQYADVDGVANDFGTSAPEYLAAVAFFSQSPKPALLYVGRWAQAAVAGLLNGAILTTAQQAMGNFTGITNGAMSITIDGTVKNISSVDFSAQTNLNGVASQVSAKLSPAGSMVWNSAQQRFIVTSATTGATSTVTFATAPGSGTDISALLGLNNGQGGYAVGGMAAESLLTAVQGLANLSSDWYGLYVAASSVADSDHLAVAAYIEATSPSRIYGVTVTTTSVLDSASTTDLASKLKAQNLMRTFTQYSST